MNIKAKIILKKMFVLLLIIFYIISMMGLSTVFADNSKKVKVAYFTDRPYFMTTSENEKRSGYVYDYFMMLSNYTGWNYEYVYGEYYELKERFLNGEIDIFPAVVKNPENEAHMYFPDHPMGSMICRLYTLMDNTEISYEHPESLNGITVGVTNANDWCDDYVKSFEQKNMDCTFVKYNSHSEKISEFEKGNVDAIIDFEALAGDRWNPVMMVGNYDYYMAISNERKDLLDEVNIVLDNVYDTEPFYNDVMYNQNYSGEGHRKTINNDEKIWIEENSGLKVGILEYASIGSTEDQNSFIKTIIDKLLEEIGLSDLKVEYVSFDSYDELVKALKNEKINVAYPLLDNNNIAEENNYSIVETLQKSPMDIITRKGFDINDVRTIVVPDLSIYNYCTVNFPNAKIFCFNSMNECMYAVEENMADAAVMQCHLISDNYDMAASYDNLIYTDCTSMGSALAVKKDQTALFSILRRGIGNVDQDYINHFSIGMSDTNKSYSLSEFIYEYYWLINAVLIIFAVLVIIVLYLVRLRKRNQKRHKQAVVYQCALYSQAVGYFQCNLSKNIMMTPYMKMIDGEPVDIVDYLPFSSGSLFSSLMDYLASHYVVSDAKGFRKFMNPDTLIKCFNDGDFKPEFSCWVIVPNNGNRVFQRYSYFLSNDKSGNITASCIVYDLSEHEGELEQQRIKAEAANIAKSTFLFNMSHDVRTPMNAIIGYANMAGKNINNTEKTKDCIEKIQSSSKQLLLLLDDALDMARVESGKIIINEQPINVLDNINRAKKAITINAEMNGIKVNFYLDNIDESEIYVDSMHLNKILSNIVDNAIKYSHAESVINIRISQKKLPDMDKARYTFIIEDHGIGMSQEFLPQIYDMFARENTSTVSGIHGTGVGMAITKKLVDLMDGEIFIESEKGKGTTVRLDFDFRIRKHAEQIVETDSQIEENTFEGKRILLVEDIDLNREIAKEILEDEGIIVEEAVDGSIAVDMVSESQPGYYDIVFMDIQMPIMDGYEATRKIRAIENKKLSQIPIIALTANALDEDIQNCLEAGMNAHLSKPINVVEMFKTMSQYIS